MERSLAQTIPTATPITMLYDIAAPVDCITLTKLITLLSILLGNNSATTFLRGINLGRFHRQTGSVAVLAVLHYSHLMMYLASTNLVICANHSNAKTPTL